MKKNWMKLLGKYVLENRRKRGFSQAELAKKTRMNTSYISRLESGDSFHSVKIDFFLRLADAFEVDEHELIKTVGLR